MDALLKSLQHKRTLRTALMNEACKRVFSVYSKDSKKQVSVTNSYKQISPGLWAKNIDIEENKPESTCMLMATKGRKVKLERHRHEEVQFMVILKGSMIDNMTGQSYEEYSQELYNAWQEHEITIAPHTFFYIEFKSLQ